MGIMTVEVENEDIYCIRFTALSAEQVKEPPLSATRLKIFFLNQEVGLNPSAKLLFI